MKFTTIYKLFFIFVFSISCHAWEVNTHRLIERKAINDSVNLEKFMTDAGLDKDESFDDKYLEFESYGTTYFNYISNNSAMSKNGFVFRYKTYNNIIEAGSILEDALWPFAPMFGANGRFLNHFYNPQDYGSGYYLGINALDWGKGVIVNWYSNKKAVEYMKQAFSATTIDERKTNLVKMYVSVGHVMHLFNDMNVPAHVRNDGHNPDPFEFWMRGGEDHHGPTGFYISGDEESGSLSGLTANANTFTDFETNFKSAAERTSTEFLSKDVVFDDLPLPSLDGVSAPNPSSVGKFTYAEKNGVKLSVIRKSYLWGYDNIYYIDNSPVSDPVHEDYGRILIPRAIANASGFVNYFFRGRIKGEFTGCELKISNISEPSLVANSDAVTFKSGGKFDLYLDDKDGTRKHFLNYVLNSPLSVNKEVNIPNVSSAIEKTLGEIPDEPVKVIVVYSGPIGNDDGVSVTYVDVQACKCPNSSIFEILSHQNKSTKEWRVTVKNKETNETQEGVYPFNLDGSLYQLDSGEWVIASCGGKKIFDSWSGQEDNKVYLIDNLDLETITIGLSLKYDTVLFIYDRRWENTHDWNNWNVDFVWMYLYGRKEGHDDVMIAQQQSNITPVPNGDWGNETYLGNHKPQPLLNGSHIFYKTSNIEELKSLIEDDVPLQSTTFDFTKEMYDKLVN
jgi:hypothetical protein